MKLYFKYFMIQLKSQMQYKSSFFMTLFGQFITSFSAFLGLLFLMQRFSQVDGFTVSEVMLCFAAVMMSFSLAECFARGFDRFSSLLGNGQFDRIMVRPRNLILQVLGSQIEFSRIGRLAEAVVIFYVVIPSCGVVWAADKILTLCMMIAGGAMVFFGLFIIYAALCFFSTEGLEFMNIFTDGGKEFGSYPMSIYGSGILKFFTYVVPIAIFQYYPLLYLTGRTTSISHMLAPLFSFAFIIPCLILWRIGIHHYKSTGS